MKKVFSIKDRVKSFRHAFNGLSKLFKEEHNSRVHLIAALIAIILGFAFKITTYQWLILILAIALVILCELLNTAIERLADKVEPNWNETIGIVKDYAAAAVLIASIAAAIVGAIIFIPKLFLICDL